MDEIERTLLVKPEVFIYRIPPRSSARGYRAADWNLTSPDWTGRLRCVALGKACSLKLEDKGSGELFACCPVEKYPGTSVEPVTDSSRYFVVCVQDSGRKAYLGMGFADRSDSFDLNVALQDHFKWIKKEDVFEAEAVAGAPPVNLDLAFKEGQTIRINIPKKSGQQDSNSAAAAKPSRQSGGGLGGILPPPPGAGAGAAAGRIAPPPGASSLTPLQSPSSETAPSTAATSSSADLLGDFLSGPTTTSTPAAAAAAPAVPATSSSSSDDPWGDFASATNQTASSGNWVQF